MGQKACKLSWFKPSRQHRNSTSSRYGIRHDSISFSPSLNSQDSDEHQYNEDHRLKELEDAQNKNSLCSILLVEVSSRSLDEPLLENTGTGELISRRVVSQNFEVSESPFCPFSYGLEGDRMSEDKNGIAFVNTDCYEPDGSDEEEDDAQDKFSLARKEANVFPEIPDSMFSELEKSIVSFTNLQSQLSPLNHSVYIECCEAARPMPLMRYIRADSDLACLNIIFISAEHQAVLNSNSRGANRETQQIRNTVDVGIGSPTAIANELNISGGNTASGNSFELVVRPKIRKRNLLERENLPPCDDEEESGFWRRSEIAEVQQGSAEYALRNSKEEMSSSMLFHWRVYEDHQKNMEEYLRKNAAAGECKKVLDDSALCLEFEDCGKGFSVFYKDENRSERGDGERFTAATSNFTAPEGDQSSSDESWETALSSLECEPRVQSSGSDEEKENTDFCFQGGEQTLLEEEEIPQFDYCGEGESANDKENNPVSDVVDPEFFLFDGNNNSEDDSSVNEDLDVEWRYAFDSFLHEFQKFCSYCFTFYVRCQKYSWLSRNLVSAPLFQTTVEHFDSLGLLPEEISSAAKETIDNLPQIAVTSDHKGQYCTICWSEYTEDEIITELPCHHLFHRDCATLWLQESGTCPICRLVLEPVPPEAASASVSLLSDHDSAYSD
ncbi:PJA2 ligase, partial [Corythaixoides concolor]|nr:PJA2 ligase [Corythaixoides concolor]